MLEQAKILLLKRRARKHYLAYESELSQRSCGRMLAEYISSDVSRHKQGFNQAMDELAKLDPNAPKVRL